MINVKVQLNVDTHGASVFTINPSAIVLGNENAHNVDDIHFELPEEWSGLTVRAIFTPSRFKAEQLYFIIPASGTISVKSSMTDKEGTFLLDAFANDLHSYTTDCKYTVANHRDLRDTEPVYTPTQIEQFLSQAQEYSNASIEAMNSAKESAESVASDKAHIDEVRTHIDDVANNINSKVDGFDERVRIETEAFNSNAEAKTSRFNTNANNVATNFGMYVAQKEEAYNTNASEKTNAFNENATAQTNTYDSNASSTVILSSPCN